MKKFLKAIGIILLVIVLIVGGFAAFLFIGMNRMDLVADDPAALAAESPMDVSERLSFDPIYSSVSINFNKGDIYWYLDKYLGVPIDSLIAEALQGYPVTLNSYGLNPSETDPTLDISANYKNIKLAAKVELELSCDDSHIYIKPSAVRLGKIRVPVSLIAEKFAFNESDLLVSFDYEHCMMTETTDILWTDTGFRMTGAFDSALLDASMRSQYGNSIIHMRILQSDYLEYAKIATAYLDDEATGLQTMLEILQGNPGLYPEIIKQLLVCGKANQMNKFTPEKANCGFYYRINPGYDTGHYADENAAEHSQLSGRIELLVDLVEKIAKDYEKSRFKMNDSGFTYNGKAFDLETYLGKSWNKYSEFLSKDDVMLGVADYSGAHNSRNPLLKKLASSDTIFSEVPDLGEEYPIIVIVKGQDGSHFAAYCSLNNRVQQGEIIKTYEYYINEMNPSEFDKITADGKIPIWKNQ